MKRLIILLLVLFICSCDGNVMKWSKNLRKSVVTISYLNGREEQYKFRGLKEENFGSYSNRTDGLILNGWWGKKISIYRKDIFVIIIKYGSGMSPDGHTTFHYGYDTSQEKGNSIMLDTIRNYGVELQNKSPAEGKE